MPHSKIHVTHVSPVLAIWLRHFKKTKQTNNLVALFVKKTVGLDACPTPSARFRYHIRDPLALTPA
jgi:hypothetical protein